MSSFRDAGRTVTSQNAASINSSSTNSSTLDMVRMNPFLPRWHPRTRGKYCTLHVSLVRMYPAATKYNISLSPVAISGSVKLGLLCTSIYTDGSSRESAQ